MKVPRYPCLACVFAFFRLLAEGTGSEAPLRRTPFALGFLTGVAVHRSMPFASPNELSPLRSPRDSYAPLDARRGTMRRSSLSHRSGDGDPGA